MALILEYNKFTYAYDDIRWHRSNLNDTFTFDRRVLATRSAQLFNHLIRTIANSPSYKYNNYYRIRDTDTNHHYYVVDRQRIAQEVFRYRQKNNASIQIGI